MATLSIKRTGLHVRRTDGSCPRIITHTEANSQAFYVGDLVYLSSGAVTECGADPATICGIALRASTNVTSGNVAIPILVLDEDTEFSMSLYNSTAATAVLSDKSKIGYSAYGIAQNANGKWVVDMTDTSNGRVTITDYPIENEQLGDYYMQVMCKTLAANRQVI